MNTIDNYNTRKQKSQAFSDRISSHLSEAGNKSVENCGCYVEFVENYNGSKRRMTKTISCKKKLCPNCSVREAYKDGLKIEVIMQYIEDEYGKVFEWVTFTVPSVGAYELTDKINEMKTAFNKLMKHPKVAAMNKGCIRKLEINYNSDYDTYNPHYHVLFVTEKSYRNSRYYISKYKWIRLWQNMMDDTYITEVYAKPVQQSKEDTSRVSRYVAKNQYKDDNKNESADKDKEQAILSNQEVFDAFQNALYRKHPVTYRGLCDKARKLYKAGGLDKYKAVDKTKYTHSVAYAWGAGAYEQTGRRILTDDEKLKFKQ